MHMRLSVMAGFRTDPTTHPQQDNITHKIKRGAGSSFSNGFKDIFRRRSKKASAHRRCASDDTTITATAIKPSMHAAMMRSLSSDAASPNHVIRPVSERTQSTRSYGRESIHVWGPPPALQEETSSMSRTSRTVSFHHQRSIDELGRNPTSVTQTEPGVKRHNTYSGRTRGRTTSAAKASLGRSPSITSTKRARPMCATPSVAELNRRSSQFVGYWCPYPGGPSDRTGSSPPYYAGTTGRISCETAEGEEEEDEELDCWSGEMGASSLTSSFSHPSSIACRSPPRRPALDLPSIEKDGVDSGSIWAVSRGWRTGLYATFAEAEVQINGFPGPLVRQFPTRSEACAWLSDDAAKAQRVPSIRTMAIDEICARQCRAR